MSNPTAAAITHVLHNKQEFPFVRGVEDLLVLSLGTSQPLEARRDHRQVTRWKEKEWIRPMNRISGEASADMVDQVVPMAFGQSRSSNYVRIQVQQSATCTQLHSIPISKNLRFFSEKYFRFFISHVIFK